jgi:hypothetical protein
VGDRQAAIVGAGGQDDGARRDLVSVLRAYDVAVCPGFELLGAVRVPVRAWNFRARVTARLVSFRAADSGREPR